MQDLITLEEGFNELSKLEEQIKQNKDTKEVSKYFEVLEKQNKLLKKLLGQIDQLLKKKEVKSNLEILKFLNEARKMVQDEIRIFDSRINLKDVKAVEASEEIEAKVLNSYFEKNSKELGRLTKQVSEARK